MPRIARAVAPGVPHHITQRGNRGANVFFHKSDRVRYLDLLRKYSDLHGLQIVAYCLMTNHVHLVAIPEKETSLAATLGPVHLRYTQSINWRKEETGLLWQGRYFSCPMDDDHYWEAVRYVERNPVRARMVERAEEYRWSSAAAHCGLVPDDLLMELEARPVEESEWSEWLEDAADEQVLKRLRTSTRTGRPAGSSSFVESIEGMLGRVLRARRVGRPRRSK